MKLPCRFTSSLSLIAIGAFCVGYWLLSREKKLPVPVVIRFECPTNGPFGTNYNLAGEILKAARSMVHEQDFLASLAERLGASLDNVGSLHVEQYRCTSIMDATFFSRDSKLTNRLGSIAFDLLTARLTNQFPGMTFVLLDGR